MFYVGRKKEEEEDNGKLLAQHCDPYTALTFENFKDFITKKYARYEGVGCYVMGY